MDNCINLNFLRVFNCLPPFLAVQDFCLKFGTKLNNFFAGYGKRNCPSRVHMLCTAAVPRGYPQAPFGWKSLCLYGVSTYLQIEFRCKNRGSCARILLYSVAVYVIRASHERLDSY